MKQSRKILLCRWIASSQKALLAMTYFRKMYLLFTMIAFLFFPLVSLSANQDDLEKLRKVEEPRIVQMDLSNTDLRNYIFTPGKIDLQGANLSHSNLSGMDLSKMNLGGADLSYANFTNAKLNQVNLANANLDHANFTGAQMLQSDLSRASLVYTNLTKANLQQAIFIKANLTCAILNQANLSKTDFSGATISGATFINTLTSDMVGYENIVENKVSC